MQQLKAISLWQPWASLVVLGHKKIETRSFNTNHRGTLLIHATTGWRSSQNQLRNNEHFMRALCDQYPISDKKWGLPFGAIVGMVTVESCVQFGIVASGYSMGEAQWPLTEQERAFGDFAPGRYGWLLASPIAFNEPIPCKGMQGFWMPDAQTMAQVETQINLALP